jgi:hypothetical protein
MNEDESMALALRYAREFFKGDAVYIPQITLAYCAYALQQMSYAVVGRLTLLQPDSPPGEVMDDERTLTAASR